MINNNSNLLPTLNLPDDLKNLTLKQLNQLAAELKDAMVDLSKIHNVHFSSNLGVIELTIALIRCFNPKQDQIVFDIGHQAYIYKMLTGRLNQMNTLKEYEGIAGFQNPNESIYDKWSAGHSSTSLSAITGKYLGMKPSERNNHFVVCIIGDGSIVSAMALEALESNVTLKTPVIIIINDNNMSISPSIGGLHQLLVDLETKGNDARNFFTDLGYQYIGVVNGHDINGLMVALNDAKTILTKQQKSVIVHIKTIKGNGWVQDTDGSYHTWSYGTNTNDSIPFTTGYYLGNQLLNRFSTKKDFMLISPSMTYRIGLIPIKNKLPDYFVDLGIQEENAVTIAAGIASMHHYRPIVATYATFLQRTYDQLWHDVARLNLGITLLLDGCNISAGNGTSHNGIFDVSMLKSIPNTIITSGMTNEQTWKLMKLSLDLNPNCIFSIRIAQKQDKASSTIINEVNLLPVEFGNWQILKDANENDVCFVSYGPLFLHLYEKIKPISGLSIVNALFISGYHQQNLDWLIARHFHTIIVYERIDKENTLGSDIETYLFEQGIKDVKVIKMNYAGFLFQATNNQLDELVHMDDHRVMMTIKEFTD